MNLKQKAKRPPRKKIGEATRKSRTFMSQSSAYSKRFTMCVIYALQTSKDVFRFHQMMEFCYKRKIGKSSQSKNLPHRKAGSRQLRRLPTTWILLPLRVRFPQPSSSICHVQLFSDSLSTADLLPMLSYLFLMTYRFSMYFQALVVFQIPEHKNQRLRGKTQ